MHVYSIDKQPKQTVLFILAFIAITIAPILQKIAEQIVSYLEINSGWSSAPAIAVPVFGVFLGLYVLFNHHLWKISWLRSILLVPDLNGVWYCDGHTTMLNGEPANLDWTSKITITQSWSKILIHSKTVQSESKSISASIYHEAGVGYRLLFQYTNSPNQGELDINNHSGSSELVFLEDAETASGSYYTDMRRTTLGTMALKKMQLSQ